MFFIHFELPNGDIRMFPKCTGEVTVFRAEIKDITNVNEGQTLLEDKRGNQITLDSDITTQPSSMTDDLFENDVWICCRNPELQMEVLTVNFNLETHEDLTAILPIGSKVEVFNETGDVLLEYPIQN